jgi:enamine deaminase RidA (YjgF/YER057c/UK114 family)
VRVFLPDGDAQPFFAAWSALQKTQPSPVPVTWLRAGEGQRAAVQAHAVASAGRWAPLEGAAGASGLTLQDGDRRWAFLGGISGGGGGDFALTTEQSFVAAQGLLAQAGMELGDVARTWFFLDKILTRYDAFNVGRSRLFKREGILTLGAAGDAKVPASTGIGVSPAGQAVLAMEALAARGPSGTVVRLPAAGKQRSAYEYGSAFSRAAEVLTPGGRCVLISGTAAIDAQGKTCFLDDAPAQIRMTLTNVQAVLQQCRCGGQDVVESIAYCKTPEIARQFAADTCGCGHWPWVVAVGDVCRADLLFEVEVTALAAD